MAAKRPVSLSLGLILLAVACLASGSYSLAADRVTSVSFEFRLAGYLPDYRLAEFDLDQVSGLTDLILFSAEPTAAGGLDLSRLKSAPWEALRQWKTRHRTRLVLCVGGWDRSAAFPAVSASPALRRKFAQEVVAACLARRFDGVDLDWEPPRDATEAEHYGLLLEQLRTEFQPHGLVLSITLAAWQPLTPAAVEAVDYVQVMAYDHPGRHSTFEGAKDDIARVLKSGAARRKIVLGLPFYGRDIKQPHTVRTWRQIVERHPQLTGDEQDGLFLNGPETIQRKTEWALSEKLGGVMLWELGQDVPGERSLLRHIHRTISPSTPPR